MITADYDRFVQAMNTYAKLYAHKLDDDQLRVYWDILADRPVEDVERRLLAHGRKSKFFPKPRDLRPVEIDHERVESNPESDARMAAALKWNIEGWQEKMAQDPIATKLELCGVLRAKYESEDDGSTVMAEKLAWLDAREAALKSGNADLTVDGELW